MLLVWPHLYLFSWFSELQQVSPVLLYLHSHFVSLLDELLDNNRHVICFLELHETFGSTHLRGHIALAFLPLPETHPRILERTDFAQEKKWVESPPGTDPSVPKFLCDVAHSARTSLFELTSRCSCPSARWTLISPARYSDIHALMVFGFSNQPSAPGRDHLSTHVRFAGLRTARLSWSH